MRVRSVFKTIKEQIMNNTLDLYAIHLTQLSHTQIEKVLDISFKKGIEAMFFADIGESMITFTNFNVITFINWTKEDMLNLLSSLGIKDIDKITLKNIYQDYPIEINPSLSKLFAIDNQKITLKEYNRTNLLIISHVISQSVALEVYENKLSHYYERSRNLLEESDTFSIFKRTKFAKFAKQLILVRHDMMIDLYLLDKPNIVWDNENAEALYNELALSLELKDRFEVVEYKLNSIKDDIAMIIDLKNHNHSSFLEWIIIILIIIEVIMGFMEWFGLKS
jgi:uncharacterized Rmd1/YagE family protein